MTDDGKPIGDKWNLDKENRKGISKLTENIPKRKKIKNDDITIEVMIEVESIFPSSFGSLENFNWSVTHEGAKEIFKDFLDRFLPNFGSFQDAINKDNSFMFHSLLSPYLNAGLLDPMECIQEAEKRATINMPIQGTASELIKVAMIKIYTKMSKYNLKSKMILRKLKIFICKKLFL